MVKSHACPGNLHARSSRPDRIVVSAVDRRTLDAERDQLLELAGAYRLAVGGAATRGLDLGDDVLPLTGSPVDGADMLTRLEHGRETA